MATPAWENTRHPTVRVAPSSTLRGVTKFEVSSHTVRGLARSAPAIPVGYARVIVAPQAHLYGMMRMFQMLGELTRPDLQVVRTMEEAYQLLRVESPEFTPLPIPEEGS
jgi:hypothetical protein